MPLVPAVGQLGAEATKCRRRCQARANLQLFAVTYAKGFHLAERAGMRPGELI